jgi:hypothetical protein
LQPSCSQLFKKKLQRNQLKARVFRANMADFPLSGKKYDGAFCTVDTFRHLLEKREAIHHLQCVAGNLKKNGVYVLGLHLLPKHGVKEKNHSWQGNRGRLTVLSNIIVVNVNRKKREEILLYSLQVKNKKYQSIYKLCTYTLNQFQNLLREADCFECMDVHDLDYDLDKPIQLNPETDEAVFVLRKK